MSTSVEIKIKGFCACFLKPFASLDPNDPIWNVQFICDSTHQALFTYPGAPQPLQLRQPRTDLFLDFESDEAPPTPASIEPSSRYLLNMSEFHGLQSTGHSRLRILRRHLKSGFPERIWMRVPRASLAASQPQADFRSYYGVQIDPSSNSPISDSFCIGQRSNEVTISFNFDQDLVVTLRNENNQPAHVPWPFRGNGGTLAFVIDNECHPDPGTLNEFANIYDIVIDDHHTKDAQYLGSKLPYSCDEPIHGKTSEEIFEDMRRNPQGDCDPVLIDPRPGD